MTESEHGIRTCHLIQDLAEPCSWIERRILAWMFYWHWDAWHATIAKHLDMYGGTVKWRAFHGVYDEEFRQHREELAKIVPREHAVIVE